MHDASRLQPRPSHPKAAPRAGLMGARARTTRGTSVAVIVCMTFARWHGATRNVLTASVALLALLPLPAMAEGGPDLILPLVTALEGQKLPFANALVYICQLAWLINDGHRLAKYAIALALLFAALAFALHDDLRAARPVMHRLEGRFAWRGVRGRMGGHLATDASGCPEEKLPSRSDAAQVRTPEG